MAHNIEYNDAKGTFSFYSLKESAWHGLGQIVDQAETPGEVLKLANLDYEVALAPLYTSFIPDETFQIQKGLNDQFLCHTPSGITMIPKKGSKIDTHFATYRKDNYDIFGVVGSRYEPVQNDVALEFIYNVLINQGIISVEDLIIETAGALGKGERIFVTAKLPTYDIAGDEVEKYILFTSSHDGSSSITAAFTLLD